MSLIVFAAIAALAGLAGQEPAVSRDCRDDNGVNRCDSGPRAETLARFSAPTIEADAASGAEVYRVLMVDGYGQDLPVIAFERRPGSSPQAVVYAADGRKLTASVGVELWGRVQREFRFADFAVAHEPPLLDGRPMPPVCLHAWVTTVEMANSPLDRSRLAPVRRRTDNTCSGGLTTQSAFGLADLALEAFPQCEALDAQSYRSAVNRLGACAELDGDVIAAAQARSALMKVEWRRTDEAVDAYWRRYTGMNATPTVTWDGETVAGELHGREVAEFLAAKFAEHPVRMVAERTTGLDSKHVEVTGVLQPANAGEVLGVYSQVWALSPHAQNWVLQTMTVTMGAQPAN
ncbi:hypothetical protein GCM10009422_23120 [Brevundimonas kwangchunensis]|uniref:SnoaL-like domain-containing protein n=1 Tax=Brevundimonas kwangchunensis TaxID=322163 RepID=A0ABN1H0W4_9CAUL